MGPIHQENVAQNPVAARPLITIHYQIEIRCRRDTAAPKFLARRRLPFFGCQLDTDNKNAFDPPIQRTDVPTPHHRRVALRAPRTRTLGRLLARCTRRTGDDVLIMQVLRREGRPCAGVLPRRHRKMRGSGRQSLLMLCLPEEPAEGKQEEAPALRPRHSSPRLPDGTLLKGCRGRHPVPRQRATCVSHPSRYGAQYCLLSNKC